MTETNRLRLPYLAAAQSQKHVTHNEALRALDALVQIGVADMDVNAPPASPAEGDRYLVGPAPTGGFAGNPGCLAAYDDGSWRFTKPRAGWIAHVGARNALYVHDGSAWQEAGRYVRSLGGLSGFGLGTEPDPVNRFAARLNSALFAALPAADGGTGDLRIVMNKPAPGATLSQVWQTGWSGRAELGLCGDDVFRLKVSGDGAAWREALVVDPAAGAVRFPCGIADAGGQALAGLRNLAVNGDFSVAQRGPGPFPFTGPPVYALDRWLVQASSPAAGRLTRSVFAPGQADVPGARFFATLAVTSTTATAFPELQTRLEDVLRLAGRQVTVSFSYRTASAGFACELAQNFGNGGSPAVTGIAATPIPPSASWTRLRLTTVLPAAAGKTVGAGSSTAFRIVLAGAAASSIDVADVQVEEGPAATAFERRPPAVELLLARRFFRRFAAAQPLADLAAEMAATPVQSGTGPFDYSAEL